MKTRAMFVSLLLLLLSATVLWAEDDPPGRVARLQYVSGSVSVQPQGTQDWVEAALNRPLTASDNIWTDKQSRAELNVGTGIFRMDSETSVTFSNLSDQTIQVELHQGTLSLHVRKLYDGEIYEIDTPNMAFTVQKSGDYRFDVQPESDVSSVTVWKGKGDATGEGPAVRVEAHERATFSDGTSMAHTFAPAPELDGFDDWGIVRDKREDHYASAQYVSPDVIGYEDLDEYGSWRTVPEYGAIWVPTHVVADWAPYRYGHWVWISPWGWTWVDDAPWGFAPFHYGRWVSYGGYWGWAPGPVYVRPVYAPALVAWFGGSNWGVSIGFGGPAYGWCPLGYGEPFIPWYRGSRGYFRNVNISNTRITNITNVTNIYYDHRGTPNRFANLGRGGTAVPQHAMLNARPVYSNMLHVSQNQFARAPHDRNMGLAPTRDSRLGVNAGRPTALPPQRSFNRPVMSNLHTPSSGARQVPFNRPGAGRQEAGNMPGRNVQTPNRPAVGGNAPNGNAPARNVPRPPNATLRSGAERNSHVVDMGGRNGFSQPTNVPRPPNATLNSGAERNSRMPEQNPGHSGATNNRPAPVNRGVSTRPTGPANTPHAPAGNGGNERVNAPHRSEAPGQSPRSGERSAPVARPPANERNASPSANGNGNNGRGVQRSEPSRGFRQSGGGRAMNVPRPTGPVRPASSQTYEYRGSQGRAYSMPDRSIYDRPSRSNGAFLNHGNYGQAQRSYSPNQRSYRSSQAYSAPRNNSYSNGRGSYGNSSRVYRSQPRYNMPSAGRSMPSRNYGSSRSQGGSTSRSSGGGRFGHRG
jgi:Family of unknown function (DUF6600)/FecR protein